MAAHRADAARERIRKLEEEEQSGFTAAVELAKAKLELAKAELDESRPAKTTLREMTRGAVGGAMIGPALASQISRLHRNVVG